MSWGHLPLIGDGLLVLQRKKDRWLKPGASKAAAAHFTTFYSGFVLITDIGRKRIIVDVLAFWNSILRTQRRKPVHSAKNITLDSFHNS